MNDRRHISEEELLLLVTGELDAAREAEAWAAVAEDAGLARAAARIEATLAAVRAEHAAGTSGDFNSRLRRRVLAEAEAARPAARRRLWRLAPLPLAAAAAVLMAWSLLNVFWPAGPASSGGVAWADVVRAVNRVEFFRAVAYEESAGGTRRVEAFYRHPNLWRVQGEEHGMFVLFVTPSGSGAFNVTEGKWRQRSEGLDPSLLPGSVGPTPVEGRMLDAVLGLVFRGKPPAGEPVKSGQAVAGQGIEVFDYAHDPSERWARIWVMKESRLPIHMIVYQPDRNEAMRVVFDYTTPVPETCFDIRRFEKALAEKPPAKPEDVFRTGLEPIGAKPTTMQQVFDLKGGYKAPVFVSVEAADTGDLLITAQDPRNRTPQGGRVEGMYYAQLFDNWGNTFYRISDAPRNPEEPILRQAYMAVPPFKKGEGQHTVTLRYTIWGHDEGGQLNYDKILHEETVDVPPPAAQGIPGAWPESDTLRDPLKRAHALYHFHASRSPLKVQLAAVDALLEKSPDDISLLSEKMHILRAYELNDDRFRLFEQKLRDRALADPFGRGDLGDMLGEYLLYLINAGRRDEFSAILARLAPAKEALSASSADRRTGAMRRQLDQCRGALATAMAVPKALAAIEKGPSPTVEMIARSRDGTLWLSVVRPPNRNRHTSDHSWSAPEPAKRGPWTVMSSLSVADKVFLRAKGTGDEIRLDFSAMIAPLVITAGEVPFEAARIPWSMTVKVPPSEVDTESGLAPHVPQWLPEDARKYYASPQLQEAATAYASEGDVLFAAEKYDTALAAFRRTLEMPREAALAHFKGDEKQYRENRRRLETQAALCLAHLGRLDEAAAIADRLAADAPKPDFTDPERTRDGGEARWVRLEMAGWLIDQKRLPEAEKLLAQVERDRPDWRLLDSRNLATRVSYGFRGWRASFENWQAWRYADLTWWRLRQAQTGLRAPPADSP
jgi:hypothetical protein